MPDDDMIGHGFGGSAGGLNGMEASETPGSIRVLWTPDSSIRMRLRLNKSSLRRQDFLPASDVSLYEANEHSINVR